MSDLDRLLEESLRAMTDTARSARSVERTRAQAEFARRLRRRRITYSVGASLLAGIAATVAILFAVGAFDIGIDHHAAPVRPATLRGLIHTGSEPMDLAPGNHSLWVANSGSGTVSRIDPSTGVVIQQIDVAGSPTDVEAGSGYQWVANSGLSQIQQIDPKTNQVASISVGSHGKPLSISVGQGAVWVVIQDRKLVRIGVHSHRTSTVSLVRHPLDVAAREGAVWVLDAKKGLVRLNDAGDQIVSNPISVQTRGSGDVYTGPGVLWIASRGSNSIEQIDPATSGLVSTTDLDGDYIDMAITPTGVWTLSRAGDGVAYLTHLDAKTGAQIGAATKLEGDPVQITNTNPDLWIALRADGGVVRIPQTVGP
ncbi:MAG: hypothetical protein QOC87_77 [Actinomycetota bacterium]|nr:hypothetical protein [Actinomycetota bacterium]